jgi:phosphate transport system permease protein
MDAITNPFAATGHEFSKDRRSKTAGVLSCIACWGLLAPVLFILSYVVWHAFPAFSVDYFLENPINAGKDGGLWGALIGTFYLVMTSLCIAVPVGVLSGIYLHEYAKDNWLTRAIGMAVTSLAGVPSIVHALFGYAAFVLGMLPYINSVVADPNNFATMWEAGLLTAAMTIAVMELPLIITSTREALGAVPKSFREACWNLGASKWQTIRTVVLPNSFSGILTGIILSVSRAAGETAPILFTGAAFSLMLPETWPEKLAPYALGDPFLAMAYHLKIIAAEVSGMPDSQKFGCAAVMILLILTINSTSILVRLRLRRTRKW